VLKIWVIVHIFLSICLVILSSLDLGFQSPLFSWQNIFNLFKTEWSFNFWYVHFINWENAFRYATYFFKTRKFNPNFLGVLLSGPLLFAKKEKGKRKGPSPPLMANFIWNSSERIVRRKRVWPKREGVFSMFKQHAFVAVNVVVANKHTCGKLQFM